MSDLMEVLFCPCDAAGEESRYALFGKWQLMSMKLFPQPIAE